MKKDKRGSYWKNISLEERTIRMAYVVSKRWAKTTKKQRSKYGKMMVTKREEKKLSTEKKLQKKR